MFKSILFALIISLGNSPKQLSVVALGDSITKCFNADCWTDTVTQKSRYQIINKGIGGETLKQMHARLQKDVIKNKPDICIIMGGTNDVFYKNFDAKKSMNEIHAMTKELNANGIYPIIGLPLPLKNPKYEKRLEELRTLIIMSPYSVINFTQDFKDTKMLPDGVHPNKVGKDTMANRVIQDLTNILGE